MLTCIDNGVLALAVMLALMLSKSMGMPSERRRSRLASALLNLQETAVWGFVALIEPLLPVSVPLVNVDPGRSVDPVPTVSRDLIADGFAALIESLLQLLSF